MSGPRVLTATPGRRLLDLLAIALGIYFALGCALIYLAVVVWNDAVGPALAWICEGWKHGEMTELPDPEADP